MRDCTCVGSCRGAEGLGVGWNCVVDNGSVEDARVGAPSARVERPRGRCEGRYPVPQTSPPRDEPFDVTYRCALDKGHDGPHGAESVSVYPTAIHYEKSEGNSVESEGNSPPWREGPAACTNCGESAKPHPAYADFVGPFCEGCWDRLREYFTSGVICPVCKHEHDRETSNCQLDGR